MPLSYARRSRRYMLMLTGADVLPLEWTGSTWDADGSGYAFNIPTTGADLITNGGFDSDTSWTKGTGWTIAAGVATKAAGAAATLSQGITVEGTWYTNTWTLAWTASTFAALFGTTANRGIDRSASGTYTDTLRGNASTIGGIRAITTTSAGTVDNVSVRALTLSSLIASVNRGTSDATVSAAINAWQTSTQVGVVANMDNAGTPANFIFANLTASGTCKLHKVVAGVYTELISASVTFVSDATLEIRRPSGNTYQVYYNNAQVGTDQTISDAGIIDNTLYGLFSTYSANKISSFRLGGSLVPFAF